MAYNDKEVSISQGEPFFLYEFNTESKSYRFTDFSNTISWNGVDWSPFPIKHTEVKQSKELSKNSVDVSIPIEGEFSDLFLGWAPDHIVTFTLRRGHFGEAETLVYWKGKVSSHSLKDQILILQCESIFTSLRRPGVRARYQRNCRHALYSSGCGLNKADFALSGVIETVDGSQLTIPEAATKPSGWFLGGAVEFTDGSFRMIISHVGSTLVITRPSRYALEQITLSGYGKNYGRHYGGLGVTLYPGCDRTLATCKNKFDNLDNQGGFKWIPTKNPMSGSSIV